MTPYIPTEIVETIIDQLHDDKPTVATCALVSRAWLPRSRVRLFRSLTYRATSDRSGFNPFLDFLKSSPDLGSLICELSFDGLIVGVDSSGRESRREHEVLTYSTLFDVVDTLPALSSLELRRVWFTRLTEEERQTPGTGTMREIALRRLTLRSVGSLKTFRSPWGGDLVQLQPTTLFQFHSILSLFSSIQQLHVHDFSVVPDSAVSRIKPCTPLYRQTRPFSLLGQNPRYTAEFWDAISRISAPTESFSVISYPATIAAGELNLRKLKRVGTELKHLTLHLQSDPFGPFTPSVIDQLDLPACAALISFTVFAVAVWSTFWRDLASLLPYLPLSTRKLTICLSFKQGDGKAFLDLTTKRWEDTRMGLDRLSNLTKLVFMVKHDPRAVHSSTDIDSKGFDDGLRAMLKRELPSQHEQGILSFSSSVMPDLYTDGPYRRRNLLH